MSEPRDPAIDALSGQLASLKTTPTGGRALWIADEHPLPTNLLRLLADKSAQFLSNRFDQQQLASRYGLASTFSDFDLSYLGNQAIEHIFFRVAKERPVVHRVINQASEHLPTGGSLWLAGLKQEGIKTHIQRAEECFGTKARVTRLKNQLSLAELVKHGASPLSLNDEDYSSLREISCGGFHFFSKPGLYGWNKVDEASKLLMDWLEENTDGFAGKRVLDLGCGYGYLSMRAAAFGEGKTPVEIVATDNCAAALAACRKNLEGCNSAISILPSDAGKEVEGPFDTILCNPPFHQGFSTTPELHQRFIRETRRLLAPNGNAWFVVNQFLDMSDNASKEKLESLIVSKSKSFKIYNFFPASG